MQSSPDREDVTEAEIARCIGGGDFGLYAILGDQEGDFIEAGHRGRPAAWAFDHPPGSPARRMAEEWKAFKERTGSEWWKLDYREAASGVQHEAAGVLTLGEVVRAFTEYLRGDDAWKSRYKWSRINS